MEYAKLSYFGGKKNLPNGNENESAGIILKG